MSFTLKVTNIPWGSVIWEGCYGPPPAAEICSGVLGVSDTWNCPYNPYEAADLRVYVYDSSWNIKYSKTGLGPIYDGKDYILDCSTGVLSEVIPAAGFDDLAITSIAVT